MSQRQLSVTLKINRIMVPEAEKVVYFRNHLCTLNHFLCIPQLNQNMKLTRTLILKTNPVNQEFNVFLESFEFIHI